MLYVEAAASGPWLWERSGDDAGQPHLVRLAWCTGEYRSERCLLVRAPVDAIDPATVARDGVPLDEALLEFRAEADREAFRAAGFSWDFHRKVIDRATGFPIVNPFPWFAPLCLMRAAAPVVKVGQNKNGTWKWPSLVAAYKHFTTWDLEMPADPVKAGLVRVRAVRAIHEGIERAAAQTERAVP
jgi:hypothetical protein